MTIGRNLVYITFLVLLIGTLALSQAHLANAEDYWKLPESAEATTPLKKGDKAPKFTVHAGVNGCVIGRLPSFVFENRVHPEGGIIEPFGRGQA